MLHYNSFTVTDTGHCRVCNEDMFGSMDYTPTGRGSLWAVADGMGGHNAGDIASRLAVSALLDHYQHVPGTRPEEWLARSFAWANQTVLEHAAQHPESQGMGATLCALAILDGQASVCSIGDSRIYVLRGDGCRQLTEDDTFVESQIRQGILSESQAAVHPRRNVLTKALGTENYTGPGSASRIAVENNDIFLLCSDGLYAHVDPNEFISIITKKSLETAAQQLLDIALTRGGSDNITISLIQANLHTQATFAEPTFSYPI